MNRHYLKVFCKEDVFLLLYLLIKSFTYVGLYCYFLNLKQCFLPPNLQVELIFWKHVYPEDSHGTLAPPGMLLEKPRQNQSPTRPTALPLNHVCMCMCVCVFSPSVVSDFLQPHGL